MEMRQFNCVTCGYPLVNRNGRYVCEACGNEYEAVEKISEAEVIALNEATALRKLWRFDDAWDRYDLILKEYPENESASWGALLCEYGIIYEEDYDGSHKINCHRLSEKPISENKYYAKLNAEHKAEAAKIEALRLSILEKSKKIQPYDVFICYKQTDEKFGRMMPTREAAWARDIYEILTHKMGLRVFFAEKALVNENTEWEPHIYAALNSAKLMFVLASSEENVNAVWVKNEWKRFHRYIKEGKEKVIRVVFDNMECYNLPKELQDTQAINHNSMNWGEAVQRAAEFLCDKPAEKSAMELQMEEMRKQNEAMQKQLESLKKQGEHVPQPVLSGIGQSRMGKHRTEEWLSAFQIDKDGVLKKYVGDESLVVIPDNVTTIGKEAFKNCTCLTRVRIPSTVTIIKEGAFQGCANLTGIVIPDSVTKMERGAFQWCSHLASIVIPNSLEEIEDCTFERCIALTNVKIPRSVTMIGDGAFYNCDNLAEVKIPNTVTRIGKNAFGRCEKLIIYYEGKAIPKGFVSGWNAKQPVMTKDENGAWVQYKKSLLGGLFR